jgi:hypothetical protein
MCLSLALSLWILGAYSALRIYSFVGLCVVGGGALSTAIFKMVFPHLAESKSKRFAKEQVGVVPWRFLNETLPLLSSQARMARASPSAVRLRCLSPLPRQSP